ncbi:aldose 1-epimerase family protein [Streptococcus hillyeri]|uniref:aldose 1-epimerase family protein n=1 Tax=Streptococcus hillyeri TaxID=2282420 RepID=UPI0034E1E15D
MVIELKNEQLTVQFSEFGGALSSIKDKDGVEYLWQGNPEYWSGQAPVLFPICGSVRDDKVFIDEKVRNIPRHGLVRKENFDYCKIDDSTVSFSFKANEKTLKEYPYHFVLNIIYKLHGSTITTEYQVTSSEIERSIPYFIGGHPGFNCPLENNEKYEDYYLEFSEHETCSIPKSFPDTGLLDLQDRTPFLENQNKLDLNYSLFSHNAITLDQLKSRSVSLKSKKSNKGIKVDFKDFPHLIIWSTTNQSPFIALEPWSGLSTSLEESDILEEKQGVTVVEPSQTSIKSFAITIL